jgi:hypothetical protein
MVMLGIFLKTRGTAVLLKQTRKGRGGNCWHIIMIMVVPACMK